MCLEMEKYKPLIIFLKEALSIISNKFKQHFNHSSFKIVKVQMFHYRMNNTPSIIKNKINFRALKTKK